MSLVLLLKLFFYALIGYIYIYKYMHLQKFRSSLYIFCDDGCQWLITCRNTFSLNLYNVSMKWTSATVASASSNSMPVITFCLALLLRMEAVKLRSRSGVAKLAGVALCLAGVFVLAFYAGPALSPVNRHRAFAVAQASNNNHHPSSRMTWVKGTFFMVLANVTWALWIVLQVQQTYL